MKIFKNLLLIVLVGFLFGSNSFGQSTWDTGFNAEITQRFVEFSVEVGKVLTFHGRIDTVGTGDSGNIDFLLSNSFNITNYDDDITNYKPQFAGYLSGGTVSTQKITCEIWGSMSSDGTYHLVNTILTSDSSTAVIEKSFDLSGKRYPWLKLKFLKTAGNVSTNFDFDLYLNKRD